VKKYKLILAKITTVLVVAVIIFSAAYVGWWRCGEMYPHAQMACFIGGGK